MLLCMRTTLDLNDELLREARRRAARDRTSLKAVVERALRTHLSRNPRRADYALGWRPEEGPLQPGVRLDDRDALFDLMEGR
jgi:Bacterial antitoxin of type II TA system, VapB